MFEDTKVATRNRNSKTDRHTIAKGTRTKGQTMIYKALHKNLMIEQHQNPWVNSVALEGKRAEKLVTWSTCKLWWNHMWNYRIKLVYLTVSFHWYCWNNAMQILVSVMHNNDIGRLQTRHSQNVVDRHFHVHQTNLTSLIKTNARTSLKW